MIETSNEVPPISVVMTFFSPDRKSTRLNSSHLVISYAVFCLKKKKINSDLEEWLFSKAETINDLDSEINMTSCSLSHAQKTIANVASARSICVGMSGVARTLA